MLSLRVSSFAAPNKQEEPHALPITITYEPEVDDELADTVAGLINSSLTLVNAFAPKGYENNLVNWSADREILKNKTITIVLAKSNSESIAPLMQNSGAMHVDALSVAPINLQEQSLKIFVILLVDKIFYDAQGRERPDGFSKLTVALAHEVLGNVQYFLEMKVADAKAQTQTARAQQEQRAFRASILFLNEIATNPKAATLPPSIRQALLNFMPFEIGAYASWLMAHPSEKPDPACEALLNHWRSKKH